MYKSIIMYIHFRTVYTTFGCPLMKPLIFYDGNFNLSFSNHEVYENKLKYCKILHR
jgi:hypothetical protein